MENSYWIKSALSDVVNKLLINRANHIYSYLAYRQDIFTRFANENYLSCLYHFKQYMKPEIVYIIG